MIDHEPVEPSTNEPPTERPERATEHVPSRVLVHTGDGKGKSTAAMGVMLRAVSAGWKVAVIQFVKSGKWRTGEEATGRALGVDWWSLGDGFTWDSKDMDHSEALARLDDRKPGADCQRCRILRAQIDRENRNAAVAGLDPHCT